MNRRIVFEAVALMVVLIGLLVPTCSAQGEGYVFVAPGALVENHWTGKTLYLGGGGEGFIHKGLSAGGDIGVVTTTEGGALGVLNANGSYHFRRDKESKVSPFITGGYTLGFGHGGGASMVNFGGGVNVWVRPGGGLRLEFKDIYYPNRWDSFHVIGFRIGWTWRGRNAMVK